jgi:adenylate cyclase
MRALRSFLFPERAVLLPWPYAVVAFAGIVVGVALARSGVGERLEWQVYDAYSRAVVAGNPPAPGVVVVALDELSFAEVGLPWPWPRALHAALVDRLAGDGARTIAFDIVFDVPSASAEDDAVFADAVRRAGNVVLAADRATIDDARYAVTQWADPIPALAQSAAAVAGVRIPWDEDGVLRRALLIDDGRPSLALAIASREPGFAPPPAATLTAPQLFRFNGPSRLGIATVSYYQALDPASLPPGFFKDKHVLVGRSLAAAAAEDADHYPTPMAVRMPGVEIHASMADALLRNGLIADPFGAAVAHAGLCAVAAALVAVTLFFLSPTAGALLVVGANVAIFGVAYWMLQGGVRVPSVAPALTIGATYAATAVYRFALVTRERRMIRRAFQHYVAPAIVDQILADPSRLKLGGDQYEVTILFSDLEGFATFSERMSPAALSTRLGEYFQNMLDVLLPQRGTLDKLIGDSIMMYFGCPLPDADHALHACRGALAMQRRMSELNERWARQSLPPLKTRIGINTGVVVAGNMGTTTIFNYTVIGDAVNLASRLEGVNKEYGTLVIVGEETWKRVHAAFETRELDWIRVKGRLTPVAIYELVAERGQLEPRQREVLEHFSEGLRLYRSQQWLEAREAFGRALALAPDDGPSRTFASRCTAYALQPPVDWDGVHTLKG